MKLSEVTRLLRNFYLKLFLGMIRFDDEYSKSRIFWRILDHESFFKNESGSLPTFDIKTCIHIMYPQISSGNKLSNQHLSFSVLSLTSPMMSRYQ
jgi:hypothetical protein